MVAVTLPALFAYLSFIVPTAAVFPFDDVEFAPGFAVLPPFPKDRKPLRKPEAREIDLTLKHVFHHGTYQYPKLHRRYDVPLDAELFVTTEEYTVLKPPPSFRVRSVPVNIQRLVDRRRATIDLILDAGRSAGQPMVLPASAWTLDEVSGPNVTDKETVYSFSKVTANAYVISPEDPDWQEVGSGFNYTEDFGWEEDGLRGHIFVDTLNRTVVIGLKGTSPAVFDGPETTHNDKVNDNLFFSCCCGQGGNVRWLQVCDCMTSTYTCNSTCVTKALKEKNRYYWAAQDLYHNVTDLYPDADIWVAGHSLGGAVSSLLGLTYGLPVITFEAVPEALPAARLGLPTPPGYRIGSHQIRSDTGAFHFGNTADPVYMGTCHSWTSLCSIGGYAMQSVCHTGHRCVYDTVKDLGWRRGLGSHKIVEVVKMIAKYEDVPECVRDTDCTDCPNWKYYESNGSEITTTMSTSSNTKTSRSRTRTATCKTPGWWGCLDETTTTTETEITTTTSSSTSTCKTPGWFGCKDEKTTTTTTTTSSSQSAEPAPTITATLPRPTTSSSSSTCATPGWLGCKDPTSTPTSTSGTPTPTATTTCEHPGWFGCNDNSITVSTVPTTTAVMTTKPPTSLPTASKCVKRNWMGWCREYGPKVDEEKMEI